MSDGNGMTLAVMSSGACARSDLGQDRMRPRQKASRAGIELIESFEGFRAKAARLSGGGWTIGFGHTRSAREGLQISRADAELLLKFADLPPVEDAIAELVFTPLTQNQYDALVAFVFNVGAETFKHSDVLKRVNEGRLTEAACALELWREAEVAGDPMVLDALIRRRAAEKALFLTPEGGFVATPSPVVRPRIDARAADCLPSRRPAEIETPLEGEDAEVRLVGAPENEAKAEAASLPEVHLEPLPMPVAFEPTPIIEHEAAAPEPHHEPEAAAEPIAAEPEPVVEHTAVADHAETLEESTAELARTVWTLEPSPPVPVAEAEHLAAASEPEEAADESGEAWTSDWTVVPGPAAAEPLHDAAPAAAEPEAGEPEAVVEIVEADPVEAGPVDARFEPLDAAPAATPEITPEPEAPQAAAPARTLAAAEPLPAKPLYSSYGPMAYAVMPPAPLGDDETGAGGAGEPDAVHTVPAPEEPASFAPAPEPEHEHEHSAAAPEPAPSLVLTSPPADWDSAPSGAMQAVMQPLAEGEDELEQPRFDEGWDGPTALSARIVRHEPVAEAEAPSRKIAATGPFILLGLIGFVAFAGAMFAFWRGHSAGPDAGDPTILAWSLALIGAACVGVSVYFLLKRLGAQDD